MELTYRIRTIETLMKKINYAFIKNEKIEGQADGELISQLPKVSINQLVAIAEPFFIYKHLDYFPSYTDWNLIRADDPYYIYKIITKLKEKNIIINKDDDLILTINYLLGNIPELPHEVNIKTEMLNYLSQEFLPRISKKIKLIPDKGHSRPYEITNNEVIQRLLQVNDQEPVIEYLLNKCTVTTYRKIFVKVLLQAIDTDKNSSIFTANQIILRMHLDYFNFNIEGFKKNVLPLLKSYNMYWGPTETEKLFIHIVPPDNLQDKYNESIKILETKNLLEKEEEQ